MGTYFDTCALVPLYVAELLSETITSFLVSRDEAVSFSWLHQLELENAIRLKEFRGEISESLCRTTLHKIRADVELGRLALRPVDWVGAFGSARRMSERVTGKTGCRSLDLMHVAVAVQWGCRVFVTADSRQLAAARLAGLSGVDLRASRPRGDNDAKDVWVVKEPLVRYGVGGRVGRIS
jgi:predicted nucleic acid-binding protein